MIGESVGSYAITAKLGEGGMGIVYAAEHSIMGRKAVVKVLRPHLSHDKTIVKRFFNEARAAASIRHPGIVDVYDVGYHDSGSAYIVMDFLEGESLAQRLDRAGKLAPEVALALIRQVLGALAAAHAQGIVHRDLKPDNIFIVRDPELPTGERAKILDFGIAKLADDGGGHAVMTQTGAVMGTPVYMSPEQCRGAGAVDPRTDLYAIGCILFQALCGRPPFVADAPGELLVAHMRDEPPAVRSLEPAVSPEVAEIVACLLAKQPEQRFASADAVIKAIDGATGDKLATGQQVPPPPAVTDTAPPSEGAIGYAATALSQPDASGAAPAPPVPDTTLGGSAAEVAGPATETARGGGRWIAIAGALVAAAAGAVVVWQLASDGESASPGAAIAGSDAGALGAASPGDAAAAPVPGALPCDEPRLVLDPVPTEAGANLRRTPDLDAPGNVVFSVPNCTAVCELERRPKWVRLRLDDGTEGWMHATRVAEPDAPRCRGGDIPPLALEPVSSKRMSLARRRNREALASHRARDWDRAIESYKAALRADPGHVTARYNLACAFNMSGRLDQGLAQLREFARVGCPVCRGRLVRAREDGEWETAWSDPRFIELTREVEVGQPPLDELARAFAEAMVARDLEAARDLVHPRNPLEVKLGRKGRKLRGYDALREWGKSESRPITAGRIEACKRNCCRFEPDAAGVGGRLRIEQICTRTDSGGVRVVSRIELSGGN